MDGGSSSATSTDGFVELAQQIARRRGAGPEVHLQAPREVGDVAFPFAQIRVRDVVEHGAELVEDALHGPRGVDALLADHVRGPRHELLIVEHQQLRVEHRRRARRRAVD